MNNTKKMIEVTSCDSGNTKRMTPSEFRKTYGTEESKEILKGYLPHLIAVEVDVPTKEGQPILQGNSEPGPIEHLYRKTDVAKIILEGLSKQKFADWYDDTFIPHIEGYEEGQPTEQQILEQIENLFKIK